MSITVRCPNPECRRTSVLDAAAVGKSFRCPGCAKTVSVRTTADGQKSAPAPSGRAGAETVASRIGRFEVREKLGAGAFGTVYRAYDPQLDREVALKVPNPGALDGPKRVERFLREAKAAANLRHPNIVPLYDAGKDGGQYFIASAFVRGKPMADLIEEGEVPFERGARLARQLAEALAYAHGEGVVHRDVKPANAMVDDHDRVHLMDFGLAARRDEESRLTNDGAVMGTPAYMAPEQAAGQQGEARPAADQYAVGVVLYELLTGRVPFEGPLAVVIHSQIHTEPEPPSAVREGVPKDLETVCLKALAKRPGDRYPGCQELADDLRRWLDGEPISARRLTRAEQLTRWARKNKAVAGLAGSLVAALVIGIVVSLGFAGAAAVQATRARDQAARASQAEKETEVKNTELTNALELKNVETLRADQEAAAAKAAALKAENEKKAATAANETAQRNLTYSQLSLAEKEWNGDGSALVANQLLDSIPERDRGLEWRLARRRYQGGLFVLHGHDAQVVSARISPDGARIASGAADGTAVVWDAATGLRLFQLKERCSGGVVYSPDGARIAAGCSDGLLRVWDSKSGAALHEVKIDTRGGCHVGYDPSGARLVAWSESEVAQVVEIKAGRPVVSLKGHAGSVRGAVFSRDGSRVVSWAADKVVRVWDAKSGAALHELKGHEADIHALALSPDAALLASAGGAGELKVWDAKTGALVLARRAGNSDLVAVAFSPDGSKVATGGYDQVVRVWEVKGALLLGLKGHTSGVTGVAFSPNGTKLASWSDDKTVRLWDATSGAVIGVLKGHTAAVRSAQFSPDGMRLVSGSDDKTVRVWDGRSADVRSELKGHRAHVDSLCVSPDGALLASGSRDLTVRIWDPRSGAPLQELKGHAADVTGLSFNADGSRLASGASDGTIRIWDTKSGDLIREIKGHGTGEVRVRYSPDGSRIVTGSSDRNVRIWDAKTGNPIHELKGHTVHIAGVCFSPDGARVASCSADRTIRIWDAGSGNPGLVIKCPNDPTSICFSPDGTRVASGSRSGVVQTWDSKTGKLTAELKGHTADVNHLSYSRDGLRLISGSRDKSIRIWAVQSGLGLSVVPTPRTIRPVPVVSPSEEWLAYGEAGTVVLLDARPLFPPGAAPDQTELKRRESFERMRQETLKAAKGKQP